MNYVTVDATKNITKKLITHPASHDSAQTDSRIRASELCVVSSCEARTTCMEITTACLLLALALRY